MIRMMQMRAMIRERSRDWPRATVRQSQIVTGALVVFPFLCAVSLPLFSRVQFSRAFPIPQRPTDASGNGANRTWGVDAVAHETERLRLAQLATTGTSRTPTRSFNTHSLVSNTTLNR